MPAAIAQPANVEGSRRFLAVQREGPQAFWVESLQLLRAEMQVQGEKLGCEGGCCFGVYTLSK